MISLDKNLSYEDFVGMYNMERKYYDEAYITPVEDTYQWYVHNRDTVVVARVEGIIVGFCNMFPVYEAIYNKLKAGEMNDAALTIAHIPKAEAYSKELFVFFSCIVIEEAYRKTMILNEFIQYYKNHYLKLEEQGIKVQGILLDAVTPGGRHFAKSIGLSQIGNSNHESVLFEGSFENFCKSVKRD